MTNGVGDAWGRVGRESVADRIDRDGEEIVVTYNATAAKVRRDEPLEIEDVERMRRELEQAEHFIDDVLEPVARGDDPERVHSMGVSER